MSGLECPYCEEDLDDPDDCYEPDDVYEEQCPHCEKYFIFTLSYSVDYSSEKADCLNGSPHDYQKINGGPHEYFVNKRRCSMCGTEKVLEEGDAEYVKI